MLNLSLLEKVRHPATHKTTARCPACAEQGGDRTGTHLAIFSSGAFACVAHPDDADHRRRIHALAGIPSERLPTWQVKLHKARETTRRQQQITHAASLQTVRQAREVIFSQYAWHPADVWDDSPQRIDCERVESDPRHFLATLFHENDFIWTGETHHSGQTGKYADHWQTCATWQHPVPSGMGPMVTPATWQPCTTSRSADRVLHAPYVVLDFDGLDGIAPTTPAELEQHVARSLAIIHFIRKRLSWKLAAILWTGSKSLHAWFRTPAGNQLQEMKTIAPTLGLDSGLIGRPEHPCRLPGMVHQKTGKPSRVLWLA